MLDYLDAPIVRLGGRHAPIPHSPPLFEALRAVARQRSTAALREIVGVDRLMLRLRDGGRRLRRPRRSRTTRRPGAPSCATRSLDTPEDVARETAEADGIIITTHPFGARAHRGARPARAGDRARRHRPRRDRPRCCRPRPASRSSTSPTTPRTRSRRTPSRCCSRCSGGSSRPTGWRASRGASSRWLGQIGAARDRSRSASSASAASAARWPSACGRWSARIQAYDPPRRRCPTASSRCASLDELLETERPRLAAPAAAARDRALLGPAQFAQMRPGALLVNVSRGGLIDEDALADALRATGRSAAPRSTSSRTSRWPPARASCRRPNTVLSPHVAWFSTASGPEGPARYG